LLAVDAKRLHAVHVMRDEQSDEQVATCELMMLHANHTSHAVEPFPADVCDRLRNVCAAHSVLPRPEGTGRGITMVKVPEGQWEGLDTTNQPGEGNDGQP
jgi:acyl-CoA thioester hydrolase